MNIKKRKNKKTLKKFLKITFLVFILLFLIGLIAINFYPDVCYSCRDEMTNNQYFPNKTCAAIYDFHRSLYFSSSRTIILLFIFINVLWLSPAIILAMLSDKLGKTLMKLFPLLLCIACCIAFYVFIAGYNRVGHSISRDCNLLLDIAISKYSETIEK